MWNVANSDSGALSSVCENILVDFVSSVYILNLGISEQVEGIKFVEQRICLFGSYAWHKDWS